MDCQAQRSYVANLKRLCRPQAARTPHGFAKMQGSSVLNPNLPAVLAAGGLEAGDITLLLMPCTDFPAGCARVGPACSRRANTVERGSESDAAALESPG